MTDARLRELRRLVRAGELPEDLVTELQSVALRLARLRLLPPSFAPYGSWDDEAAAEVFAAWYADRLLAQGHLQSLLDRARTPGAFRRLAERSLRQHLVAAQDRNQRHNLFKRLVSLLDDGDRFTLVVQAARAQDRWYALPAAGADPWSGSERELAAAAWSLGDFALIRYRAGATKLSPVLGAEELERFVAGLVERLDAAVTPAFLMRALALRFGLGDVEVESLQAGVSGSEPGVAGEEDEILLRDTARQVLAELSQRQAAVLRATVAGQPVAEMAAQLGCSAGTIVNEQRRVGEVVTRFSADDGERDRLLNIVADLLYWTDDE
jgi:DNA-binding CsgD family transcriptional regulator